MEELLAWLKDMRLLLASHLPDSYDDLQGELKKCEVCGGYFIRLIMIIARRMYWLAKVFCKFHVFVF